MKLWIRRHPFAALLSVLLLIAGGFLVLQQDFRPEPQSPAASPAPEPGPAGDPAAEMIAELPPEAAPGIDTGREPPPASARSEPPAGDQPPAEAEHGPPPETQSEYIAEFERLQRSVSDGDEEHAIELAGNLQECEFGIAEPNTLQRHLQYAEERYASNRPIRTHRHGAIVNQGFDTYEAYARFLQDTFDRCQSTRHLMGDDLRDRLADLADRGNVAARYVYAMWRPRHDFNSYRTWASELDYQERAQEYTWQNVAAREPLGLLALAQSESAFGSLFTASSPPLASVLLMASFKCGLQSPGLLVSVSEVVDRLEQRPDTLERLNSASDEVKALFCD